MASQIVDFNMAIINQKKLDFYTQDNLAFEIKVYIEDSGNQDRDPEYVDFTNRLAYQGKDLLRKISSITEKMEGKAGMASFISSVNSIEMDNKNGFWNKPIPQGSGKVYNKNYPSVLRTMNNNIAYFDYSRNYNKTVWHKHKVKITLVGTDGKNVQMEDTLIVAIINNIKSSRKNNMATVSLWSLSLPLKNLDISNVRDGLSWWSNRPISFLLNKILKKEYGTIPTSFVLPDSIKIPTAKYEARSAQDARVISQFGRAPEYDLDNDVWQNLGLTPKAIAKWQWTQQGPTESDSSIGVLVSTNNALEVNCRMSTAITNADVVVGDSLTILQDDTYNNTGSYIIKAISGNNVTLESPLAGKSTGGSRIPFVINRIYMGCSDQLWVYLPDRDVYRLLDNTTLGSGWNINRLWFNPNDGKIYGAAWQDHSQFGVDNGDASSFVPYSWKSQEVKIFTCNTNMASDTDAITVIQTLSNVLVGDVSFRNGKNVDYSLGYDQQWVGPYGVFSGSGAASGLEALSLPYRQSLTPMNVAGWNGLVTDATAQNLVGNYTLGDHNIPEEFGSDGYRRIDVMPLIEHKVSSRINPSYTGGASGTTAIDGVIGFGNGGERSTLWSDNESKTDPRIFNQDVSADYYSVGTNSVDVVSGAPGMWLKHYSGQKGFMEFNPTAKNAAGVTITNGAIWFCVLEGHDSTYIDGHLKIKYVPLDSPYTPVIVTETINGGNVDNDGSTFIKLNGNGAYDTNWTSGNCWDSQPLCGCKPPGQTEGIIISLAFWSKSASIGNNSNLSVTPTGLTSILYFSAVTATTRQSLYESDPTATDGSNFTTPTEMVPIEGSNNFLISMFHRNRLGQYHNYSIGRLDYTAVTPETDFDDFNRLNLNKQPFMLTGDDEERKLNRGTTSRIYFVQGGTGALYEFNPDSFTVGAPLDFGAPVVDSEVYLNSNIIVDSITRIRSENSTKLYQNNTVWGVSAPHPKSEVLINPMAGKYYLWKYDCFMSSRIEVADFKDLTAWEAMSAFAQISGYIMGFNEGDFYFIPKVVEGPSLFEFSNDGVNNYVNDISISEGLNEVYNKVEITPYSVVLEQPTWKLSLVTRTDDTSVNNDIVLNQQDNQRKTIKMVCVHGGKVTQTSVTDTSDNYEGGIFEGTYWTYSIFDRIIETSLRALLVDPTIATTFTLNDGLLDLNKDDIIEVYTVFNGLEFKAIYLVDSDPTDSEIITGTVNVTFQPALSTANMLAAGTIFPINSIVKVVKEINWQDGYDSVDRVVFSSLINIKENNKAYDIGSSNISILFNDPNSGSTEEGKEESIYIAGDSITVEARGLVSTKNENARQLQVDMLSISQHGRNPFPEVNNRFINYKTSRELTAKLLVEFAWPKHTSVVSTKLLPFIKFTNEGQYQNMFSYVDEFLFPLSNGHKRDGYLKEVTHNVLAGTSSFVFRDTKPY